VRKVSEEKLFYVASGGIFEEDAVKLFINGYCDEGAVG